jgi:polyisoprenoid-binding protein YceI
MMKTKLLFVVLLFSGNLLFGQEAWTIDKSHTEILFSVKHLVISEVGGKFKDFDGEVKSNGDGFDGSEIQFKAFVESINTDNEQRDGHLKSDDFFNAAEYPELKFDGKLVKNGSGYILKGEMTIRDVTKPIAFDVQYNGTVTDPWGNTKAGFKITGSVNRFDYGLKWNALMEAGGAVVDEEINIVCNVELQKQV